MLNRPHVANHRLLIIAAWLVLALLTACNETTASPTAALPSATSTSNQDGTGATVPTAPVTGDAAGAETAAPTPGPVATPTEPIAVIINGETISMAAFTAELAQFELVQRSLGHAEGDYTAAALDMLIDRVLINQAAAQMGLVVTPTMIDERIAELTTAAEANGGPGAFTVWLEANQMTLADFRTLLGYEMLTSLVAERITLSVPSAVPQVRARYLQVDDPGLAQTLRDQLLNGADFGEIAAQYSLDQSTGQFGGELGYFAEGTLLVPEVDAAAFQLAVGAISEVIGVTNPDTGASTYYIVQVLDVDPARPLTADARHQVLQATYNEWLANQRAAAQIEILVDLGS